MFEEYTSDLFALSKSQVESDDLQHLIEKYKVSGIVGGGLLSTKDKDVYQKTDKIVKEWIKDDKLYVQFLFSQDKDDQEVIKQLVMSPHSHMRSLLAECIDLHAYEIALSLEVNSQSQLYKIYLSVLVHLLADSELSVALKIQSALKKIMTMENNVSFMEDDFWLERVNEGIEQADEVIAIRFMDLVIGMSNMNERIHNKLVEKGLLNKVFQLYRTDDLLLKVNTVEIFAKFGEKKYNAKYLQKHKITQQILKEAFDNNEEFYIRKYALILIVKMISNSAMELTSQLSYEIKQFIKQLLFSKENEEVQNGFEILQYVLRTQEGIDLLLQDKDLLRQFLSYTDFDQVELRKKCISAFTSLLQTGPENHKNKNIIYNIFISFGRPELVDNIIDYTQIPNNLDQMQQAFSIIEYNLFSEFDDIELIYMFFLYQCFLYDEICQQYIKTPGCVEYLTSRPCSNKQILDMKDKLRERLISVCKSLSQSNKEFDNFLENYNKAFQTKTLSNQESHFDSQIL